MPGSTCDDPVDLEANNETTRLEVYLRTRIGGRVRALQILERADGLVLRGQTRSFHVKQLAQHVLMGAGGRRLAANEIEVERYVTSFSEPFTDLEPEVMAPSASGSSGP
jgi:hypothetical protein